MKNFLLFIMLLAMPFSSFATITADQEYALNKMNTVAQKQQLGSLIHKNVNVVVGKYSFAVQGGAVGDISLLSDLTNTSSTIVIPDKAIIKQVWIDVLTTPTSGGAATVALKAQSAADLLAATAVASITGVMAGVPVGVAGNMIKITADRTLKATVAAATLTAGKFNVYVEYVLGD